MLSNEIWKEITDLLYGVSNLGNIRRNMNYPYKHKNKLYVMPYLNNKGYWCVNLYKHSKVHKFLVHRLIALYFIPNPNNLPEVNHIDGNKQNNSISNLEWITHKQNTQHAWDNNLFKNRHCNASNKRKNSTSIYKGVSWSNQRKKWCVYVTFKKKRYGIGRFNDEILAAKAYDDFIIKMGMQAYGYSTNFI